MQQENLSFVEISQFRFGNYISVLGFSSAAQREAQLILFMNRIDEMHRDVADNVVLKGSYVHFWLYLQDDCLCVMFMPKTSAHDKLFITNDQITPTNNRHAGNEYVQQTG
jgi:hypothetical protein